MGQKIRIKLKSFDHNLVDKSSDKIVKAVKTTGAVHLSKKNFKKNSDGFVLIKSTTRS